MKATVIPTLTAFGRSRGWTKAQIRALQVVQNYAIQRAMGMDKMAMQEYHVTNTALHKAAGWEPIENTLARNTLKWLGHVARMNKSRLPKLALWGWWGDGELKTHHATRQTQWLKIVLSKAEIHEMHWFRQAQNWDQTKWDALIRRAYPPAGLTKEETRKLDKWEPGQNLPMPQATRKRKCRKAWSTPHSKVTNTSAQHVVYT